MIYGSVDDYDLNLFFYIVMAESMLALEREAVIRQQNVADMIASGASSVGKFYSGSNVFVTGGSGFIGKQLLEKLFR